MTEYKEIKRAAGIVQHSCGPADIAVILGSGLGGYEEQLMNPAEIEYDDIPGFPLSTVPGHAGKFIVGTVRDKRVLVMSGRFHSYEGYSMEKVTLPVRVMSMIGVKTLIVTNAAGAVNESFKPGDLVIIDDYINLSGRNPLRGKNLDRFGPRFPDMTYAYDPELRAVAEQEAKKLGIDVRHGVYCWMNGPSFETPAEIRMARILGADLVGMSTVPETIVARHCGMRVLGISSVTNMAAGVLDTPINHEEVLAVGEAVREPFRKLVDAVIDTMPESPVFEM
ncbi:MAG: purine-nucleoside phosphorylase [Clostridiales bacterium]|nr:purine-nucleoside phosphorylase [Clostridiales bacterium]